MAEVNLSPQSREHVEGLFEFYESQQMGKGSSWIVNLIDALDRLEVSPRIGAYLTTRSEGIRYLVTQDQFKTIIVYRIMDQIIQISGIYDSRSNWKKGN